mmetsp:Transcript_24630/g.43472  ORF Transcript_24630/g.43472 Transcript_24630/m.43472 type:complete len:403 (+) Transcript_24630:855-2063(+)
MGCFWFMSARIDDFTPDCWVVRRGILNSDVMTQYLNSVYWAFTTVTTVGYGDISATTQLEMILAVTWMITGVGFYSFTIGSLSSFLSAIDTRDSILNAKLAALHEFAKETGISTDCKRQISAVVSYNTSKLGTIWSDKHSLFQELPKDLRYEVAITMYNGIATEIPFLKGKNHAFVIDVMPLLRPLKLSNEDHLYKEGDYAYEMFMITRGRVNLVLGNEVTYKSYLKGSYLGETEIIFKTVRLETVQACGETEFLTLGKKDLLHLLEEFPSEARTIRKIAKEKRIRNKKAKRELLELIKIKSEVGTLTDLAGKRNNINITQEPEPEASDDEGDLEGMIDDLKATTNCVIDLRDRTERLEQRLDELLHCFRGGDKPGVQASIVTRLIKRKQKGRKSQTGSLLY